MQKDLLWKGTLLRPNEAADSGRVCDDEALCGSTLLSFLNINDAACLSRVNSYSLEVQ